MYKHASEVLCKKILPYAVGVHGLDIPYPAKLIREDGPVSESGSVIFRLDERRSFIAEYFAYDVFPLDTFHLSQSLGDKAISVRLVDTGIELPVHFVNSSRKTSTLYSHITMPQVGAFECSVSGWIGDSSAEMKWRLWPWMDARFCLCYHGPGGLFWELRKGRKDSRFRPTTIAARPRSYSWLQVVGKSPSIHSQRTRGITSAMNLRIRYRLRGPKALLSSY